MAIGDIYIRRNAGDESILPNAGADLFAEWDTVATEQGTVVSGYTADTFTLPAGMYLIMYSEKFSTADTTNNERLEVQGEINVSTGQVSAYTQDFIRKSSGQQDCSVNSAMVLEASSTVSFKTRFYRTDDSVSGVCQRVSNFGSVMILQLDPTNAYGMYTNSSSQNFTITEAATNFDTTLRQDSGFSRTGNTITIADAGRYFITYSMPISTTETGREDVLGRLTNNGVEIVGTNSFSYSWGADGCQGSALSWQGIVDLPAGTLMRLNISIPTSATLTSSAGSPSISLWKLPTAGKTAILEATSGDYNAPTNFTFDTTKQIDASFSTDLQTITVPGEDYYLIFSTFHQDAADSLQRGYPQVRVNIDGALSKTSSAGVYHRASGSGAGLAVTINDLATVLNGSIQIFTEPTGASGSMTCDSGQFSVLSLSSIFGAYTLPARIDSISDDTVAENQSGLIISGRSFEEVQGNGGVYFSTSAEDSPGRVTIAQTVTSWSDTSITFDSITDAFSSGVIYLFVITDGFQITTPIKVSFGILSYDFIVEDSLPDHRWTLDNTYDDTGNRGGSNMSSVVVGTHAFTNDLLSAGTTKCARMQNGKREAPNSSYMNLTTTTYRLMGGWIRLGSIAESLTCIYEEGGSINNLAFFVGVGNVLVAQLADSADDNVQMFSDFSLVVGRTYHIMFTFDYFNAGEKEFLLYIDGVKQSVSSGNPLLANNLDAHSGDIAFGQGGGNLEVGGTDVLFAASPDWYLSNWVTYVEPPADTEELISILFERGAVPTYTITQDTEANMQAQLDVFANTSMPNTPLTLRIEKLAGGGALTLDANAITFDDAASIHLESRAASALNWINSNGTNLTIEKCLLTAGPINILNPVVLTLNTLQVNTEVKVYNSSTGVEVGSVENSTTSESFDLLGISSVDIVLVSLDYKYLKLSNVNTTSNVSLPIQQQFDRNYTNP